MENRGKAKANPKAKATAHAIHAKDTSEAKLKAKAKPKPKAAPHAKAEDEGTAEAKPKAMPKANATPTAKTACVKRPSAAASSKPKRPKLEIDVDMSDVFENLKAELAHDPPRIARGAFTSRAYDRAKYRAKSQGYSPIDANELAKANFAEATRMWVNRIKYVPVD